MFAALAHQGEHLHTGDMLKHFFPFCIGEKRERKEGWKGLVNVEHSKVNETCHVKSSSRETVRWVRGTPRVSASYTGSLVVHGVFAVLQIQTSFLEVHHSLLGYVDQSAGYGYTWEFRQNRNKDECLTHHQPQLWKQLPLRNTPTQRFIF